MTQYLSVEFQFLASSGSNFESYIKPAKYIKIGLSTLGFKTFRAVRVALVRP